VTIRTRLALAVLVAIPLAGQAQDAPAPAGAAPPAAATPLDFNYESGGRRDPFVDLLTTGRPVQTTRGEGAAGFTLSEVVVSGVVQSRGLLLAMIQGPDRKTYVIHPGDKLADGVVTSVTSQGIIVLQDIQDQLDSPRRQREVTKLLRSFEGVRE
jgi:Tfp pilus assembly protein PilP